MIELLAEVLKKLPIDALIYLCFTVVIVAGFVLIPFWVKRVEGRMADIHRANNQLTSDALEIGRLKGRVRKLEDDSDLHDRKFNSLDVTLAEIKKDLTTVMSSQLRIMAKLDII